MSKDNDGGPAFPVWELNGQGQQETTGFGMTLRDYFAAKAMQATFTETHASEARGYNGWRDELAREAYRIADAMLAAREST